MKIGDYIRTKDGFIAKLIKVEKTLYIFDNTVFLTNDEYQSKIIDLYEDELKLAKKKTSRKLKDLIETGDFITYKHKNMYWLIPTSVYAKSKDNKTTLMVDDYTLNEIEILSIVTKEQFSSMEYKVGE